MRIFLLNLIKRKGLDKRPVSLILFDIMNSISISDLKVNPSKAIISALDFPLAIESRNKIQGYLLGKDLYETIISYIEDSSDRKAVEETDFKKGRTLDAITKEIGL